MAFGDKIPSVMKWARTALIQYNIDSEGSICAEDRGGPEAIGPRLHGEFWKKLFMKYPLSPTQISKIGQNSRSSKFPQNVVLGVIWPQKHDKTTNFTLKPCFLANRKISIFDQKFMWSDPPENDHPQDLQPTWYIRLIWKFIQRLLGQKTGYKFFLFDLIRLHVWAFDPSFWKILVKFGHFSDFCQKSGKAPLRWCLMYLLTLNLNSATKITPF